MTDELVKQEESAPKNGKKFIWILALAAAAALLIGTAALSGCPAGVVRDGVVVLDNVAGVAVTAVTDNAIELTSKVDTPIAVGDVIISKEGGGILRRVTAVGQKGEAIAAKTQPATLEDALESGQMITTFGFTPENFAASGEWSKNDKGETITLIDFSNKTIYQDYGIRVSVDKGTLDCTPDFVLNATWANRKLETFNLTTSGTIKLNLDLKIAVDDGKALAGEWDIIKPIYCPFATSIGSVPVYGHVALTLPVGIVGHLTGNTYVESGLDITDEFVIDSHYANKAWSQTTVDADNFTVNGHPLTWNIDIGGNVVAYVKLNVELSLYEAATVGLYVKPYLNTDIHVFPSPASVCLTAGLDAGGTYNLGILGFNVLTGGYNWAGPTKKLYENSQDYSDPLPWTSGSWNPWEKK